MKKAILEKPIGLNISLKRIDCSTNGSNGFGSIINTLSFQE